MSGNSVPNSPPFVIFQHGTQYRPTRCETCGCPASPGRQDMGGHPEEHTLTDSGDRTEHRDEKAGLLGGGGIRPESQGKHIQSRNTPPGVPLVQGASPSPRGVQGFRSKFFCLHPTTGSPQPRQRRRLPTPDHLCYFDWNQYESELSQFRSKSPEPWESPKRTL